MSDMFLVVAFTIIVVIQAAAGIAIATSGLLASIWFTITIGLLAIEIMLLAMWMKLDELTANNL